MWFIVKKSKIFWSYVKHFWTLQSVRKCRIFNRLSEINSCFHMKQRNTGKVQFLFLRRFLQTVRQQLSNNSMKCWNFPDICEFPKILCLESFGNSYSNSYIPCLLLIIALRFTCGESKICGNIKISQNIMTMIVCKIFFCFLGLY